MAEDENIHYIGEPSEKQKEIVSWLMELMQNVDVVLGAKVRFENLTVE